MDPCGEPIWGGQPSAGRSGPADPQGLSPCMWRPLTYIHAPAKSQRQTPSKLARLRSVRQLRPPPQTPVGDNYSDRFPRPGNRALIFNVQHPSSACRTSVNPPTHLISRVYSTGRHTRSRGVLRAVCTLVAGERSSWKIRRRSTMDRRSSSLRTMKYSSVEETMIFRRSLSWFFRDKGERGPLESNK